MTTPREKRERDANRALNLGPRKRGPKPLTPNLNLEPDPLEAVPGWWDHPPRRGRGPAPTTSELKSMKAESQRLADLNSKANAKLYSLRRRGETRYEPEPSYGPRRAS